MRPCAPAVAAAACVLLLSGAAATGGEYAAQIEEGLEYFREQAAVARPKVDALHDAIAAGDLMEARAAYVAARPQYEQIEVLAPGFGDIDCAIDCRAYAYTYGEGMADPGGEIAEDELQGFHRIEAMLFRDATVAPALRYAKGLQRLWVGLEAALAEPANFDFCGWWDGTAGLATEVGAKKMSSEEETFSDESVLIFDNNFIGIRYAAQPWTQALAGTPAADGVLTALDAADASVASFVNDDGTYAPYSTVPEGARAKITTAAYALAGALSELRTAAADAAGIACPEEQEAEEECTPEASTPMLQEAADYMKALNVRNVPKVRALVAAIAAGEPLAAVRELYRQARPVYEQVEVLAPAFPAEDEALDARPYSFAEGEESLEFRGFHRIERFLYRENTTDPSATDPYTGRTLGEWADDLLATYLTLDQKVQALPGDVPAHDVFSGVIGVMTEVAAKKISSEEEALSHMSLMIFHNNWLGGYSQIAPYADKTAAGRVPLKMALFRAIGCVIPHIRGTSLAGMGFTDNVTNAYVEQLTAIRYYPYFTVGLSTRECVTKYGYQFIEQIVEVANELGIPAECSTFHKDAVYPYNTT